MGTCLCHSLGFPCKVKETLNKVSPGAGACAEGAGAGAGPFCDCAGGVPIKLTRSAVYTMKLRRCIKDGMIALKPDINHDVNILMKLANGNR